MEFRVISQIWEAITAKRITITITVTINHQLEYWFAADFFATGYVMSISSPALEVQATWRATIGDKL